ncbi:3886_t:CDS:2 [Entrophospora sp. SA101]|nr:3886_t:CDS:2 [Entrophospora sp. SA101]
MFHQQLIQYATGNEPLESVFELPKGWALKSNQKYGQKGGGNHMPVQITSLLEGFFLAGEADRTRRYTAETMLEELNVMVEEEGQFDKSKVPKLQTIKCKKNLERSWYSH